MVNLMMKVLIFTISLLTFFLCIESWILRLPCKTEADFSKIVSNFKLTNNLIAKITTNDSPQCVLECIRNDKCESLNYKEEGGEYNCELNGMTKEKAEQHFKAEIGWKYLSTDYNTSKIGSVCESLNPCDDKYCVDACNELGYNCLLCAAPKQFAQPIQPYCKLAGAKNLALNRPAKASTVYANRMASFATNGVIETDYRNCFTSNKTSPSWWKVELKALAFIHTISVWVVRENFKVDIRAGTSNANMGESNPLCAQSVDLLVGQRNDIKCPDPTLGHVVSLITQQFTHLRLCEVEVHGVYVSS